MRLCLQTGGVQPDRINDQRPLLWGKMELLVKGIGAECMETVLVTGGAGFIGSHLVQALLSCGMKVIVVDNFNDFYPHQIKENNLKEVLQSVPEVLHGNLNIIKQDILDLSAGDLPVSQVDAVIHLAAMAGVRPSIKDPRLYQEVNVVGTQNVLDLARELRADKFILMSSSSVYGVNPKVPWSESDNVLEPISPYAASKVSCEFLCSVYHHLYKMPCIALRLFTVYGPRQRPDLAISKFIARAYDGETVRLFGDGSSARDYTFVSDIVEGILSALKKTTSDYEVINLGNSNPVKLLDLVRMVEKVTGRKLNVRHVDAQPGDVPQTYADVTKARNLLQYEPKVSLFNGIKRQVEWYERNLMVEVEPK